MRASRLMSILLSLQAPGRLSAKVLADELEVSVRTIYRDIDELSAAGVPVYAEKGPSGGFELLEGYRTRLNGLDRPEAQALFLSGLPDAAAQLGFGGVLANARLKLLAALPDQTRADAETVAGRFHMDPVSWFHGPDEQAVLPTLALAVWDRRSIHMRYDAWKGVVERAGVPLGLVLKAGLWYMVALVDGQARTYRVASILSLDVGAVSDARPPAGFDLADHWNRFAREYEDRMQEGRADIRARAGALRLLARSSRAVADAVAAASAPDADGWAYLTIPVEPGPQGISDLLRYGADIEILAPADLRADMAAAAHALVGLYRVQQ